MRVHCPWCGHNVRTNSDWPLRRADHSTDAFGPRCRGSSERHRQADRLRLAETLWGFATDGAVRVSCYADSFINEDGSPRLFSSFATYGASRNVEMFNSFDRYCTMELVRHED